MGSSADESITRMKANGVTFVDIDRAPFVTRMKAFYDEMENKGELPDGFLNAVASSR
jgi:TRAP-type C4-dicarboxylate transport system substrate-binding protein